MVLSTMKDPGNASFKLFFNKKESVFKENRSLKIDDKKINLTKIFAGKGMFYTNKNSKKIVNQKESLGELFLIDIPPIKWVLTQENKKIGQYTCYKATATKVIEGRSGESTKNITAWYTPQLPINYGPKDYFGLPGLIIRINRG